MANQFYARQRVRHSGGLLEIYVTGEGTAKYASFAGVVVKEGIGYEMGKFSATWSSECFTLIDPPRTVLTDWQRKQIEQFRNGTNDQVVIQMDKLISILSEPEPPKYIPNQYDVILLRNRNIDPWLVDVFDGIADKGHYRGFNMFGSYCRPFDAALVGKVTND